MPAKGRSIIVLDRYTLIQIARFSSVKEAARELEIPENSIYMSIWQKTAVYDSYFVYEKDSTTWRPTATVYRRVNGIKVSRRLEELRNQAIE